MNKVPVLTKDIKLKKKGERWGETQRVGWFVYGRGSACGAGRCAAAGSGVESSQGLSRGGGNRQMKNAWFED